MLVKTDEIIIPQIIENERLFYSIFISGFQHGQLNIVDKEI